MGAKRETDRIYNQAPLEIFDKKNGLLLGHLANYSPGGLMLTGKNHIPKGTVIDCKMIIPDNILSNREMPFRLKAVWCEEDIMPGDYTIGFQFQHIAKEDFRLLVNINEGLLNPKS